MLEIWKDIEGFEGIYQVSNFGNIKSLARYRSQLSATAPFIWIKERILKPRINKYGYGSVYLFNNNIKKFYFIHTLVILAFVPNLKGKKHVNHIDGIKLNNRADNLEWCTDSENQLHRYRILKKDFGSSHPGGKLSEVDVNNIRDLIKQGLTNVDLAKKFKVTDVIISRLRNNKTYKSVEVNQ